MKLLDKLYMLGLTERCWQISSEEIENLKQIYSKKNTLLSKLPSEIFDKIINFLGKKQKNYRTFQNLILSQELNYLEKTIHYIGGKYLEKDNWIEMNFVMYQSEYRHNDGRMVIYSSKVKIEKIIDGEYKTSKGNCMIYISEDDRYRFSISYKLFNGRDEVALFLKHYISDLNQNNFFMTNEYYYQVETIKLFYPDIYPTQKRNRKRKLLKKKYLKEKEDEIHHD